MGYQQVSEQTPQKPGELLISENVSFGILCNMLKPLFAILFTCSTLWPSTPFALQVTDDTGRRINLDRPARRVVSLAPHTTELLFAAGAGNTVVGVVSYSDYPPEAKNLPLVGGYESLDVEAILTLKPDLVIAWQSGNNRTQLEQLIKLGLAVYISEPGQLEDIATSLQRLGQLTGNESAANQAADSFRSELQRLRERYAGKTPVTVFYEIWHQPLMTVNGEHLISHIIRVCGGRNIFSGISTLAPAVDREAVISANPDAIIASGVAKERPEWLDKWRDWPQLSAVQGQHLYFINPDLIQRHSPRLLQGARIMCEQLEQVRTAGNRGYNRP